MRLLRLDLRMGRIMADGLLARLVIYSLWCPLGLPKASGIVENKRKKKKICVGDCSESAGNKTDRFYFF